MDNSDRLHRHLDMVHAGMVLLGLAYLGGVVVIWIDVDSEDLGEGRWVAFVAVTAFIVLLEVLMTLSARRCWRYIRSDQLIESAFRHLELLEEGLAPADQRALRLALAPRLLSVADASTDPLAEPIWPDTQALLGLILAHEATIASRMTDPATSPDERDV